MVGATAATLALGACGQRAPVPNETERNSNAPNNEPYDAIVIGGGFAGVTAARDLSHRGRRTLLLEARPRLGGRTFTAPFAGHDVDFGGTWIGLEQPFVWAERLRYGIELAESAAFAVPEQAIYFGGGRRYVESPARFAERFSAALRKFMAPAAEVFPRPFDPFFSNAYERYDKLSCAEVIASLKLAQPELDIVASLAAINGHNFNDQIGYLDQLKWYALGGFDPLRLFENCARFRLKGGTQSLLTAMQNDSSAEVRMSSPVTSVVRDGDIFGVAIDGGELVRGRSLIVAVPLNTLANIRFEPGISADKTAASREKITGAGTKVYAQLKGKQPVFSGSGAERMAFNLVWTEYADSDSQIAVGFGPPGLLDINDNDAVQKAVSQFMPDIEVVESAGYNWTNDPYSQSTWCMYRPTFFTRYLRELQRPEGRIFFAGSDIANGWRGFIDGAIESGARAALQAHAALAA
jgi:monoamine oxidase